MKWRQLRQVSFALSLMVASALVPIGASPAHAQTSDQIQSAQEALSNLGYKVGKADGFMGRRTHTALKSYQLSKNLAVTGELDDATRNALAGEGQPTSPANTTVPAPSNDSGGGGMLWFLLIIGGVIWFAMKMGKPKSASASRPVSVASSSYTPQQPVSSYRPVAPTTDRLRVTGASLVAALAEESQNCWVPLGQSVPVANYDIAGGVYVGSKLHRQDGFGGENCLIDACLKVADQPNVYGTDMPYWPSYSLITPSSRCAFLKWLAEGKSDAGAYIGYVFLYFYGLERRLMLDDAGDEADALLAEVRRLHRIYKDNHSFNKYASALLSAAAVKYKRGTEWPALSLQKVSWQLPLDLLMAIGTSINQNIPLDAFQMLGWYNSHPDKRLPPLAARCSEEFKALFKTRFDKKYPKGVTVNMPKRTLSASYRAASSTFTVDFQVGSAPIPDVSQLVAPLNSLDAIVDACAADLSTYARIIGKDRSPRNEMAAAAALPAQLLTEAAGSPIARLKAWLDGLVNDQPAGIELSALLGKVGAEVASDGKVTKADLVLAAEALSRCGFGMEPDPKIAYPSSPNATEVVVFRATDGARLADTTPEFLAALAHIDIGMMVAAADSNVAPSEIELLKSKILKNPELSTPEKTRLVARLAFLAKYPPTTRIFSKFKDRPLPDRETVARLALSVAGADGVIAVEEVRMIEKLYKALDLDTSRLYGDLQSLNMSDDQPPVIALGEPTKSVPVPPRPKTAVRKVTLDPNRLAKTRADTALVSTILGEIFNEDSAGGLPGAAPIVAAPAISVPATDANRSRFPGLDPKYVSLLAAIAAHNSMERGDFEALTGLHNLMCDGAIEAINDWAYDRFDGPILDDGPHILINKHILSLAEGQQS